MGTPDSLFPDTGVDTLGNCIPSVPEKVRGGCHAAVEMGILEHDPSDFELVNGGKASL